MTNRTIPVDNAKVDESTLTQEDWDRAEGAHERFKDLLETKPRAKARYDAVLAEINERQATLRRLREARALTQSTLAELLEMDQSEISRLERRSDMLLSTLKRFVHANGGELPPLVRVPLSAPLPLLVFYFTLLTAPAAVFVALRYWNAPRSLVRPTRAGHVAAIVLGVLQLAGWVFLFVFLVRALAEGRSG